MVYAATMAQHSWGWLARPYKTDGPLVLCCCGSTNHSSADRIMVNSYTLWLIKLLKLGDAYIALGHQWFGYGLQSLSHTAIWTNADLISIGHSTTNHSEIWMKIHKYYLKKLNKFKMLSAKCQPSALASACEPHQNLLLFLAAQHHQWGSCIISHAIKWVMEYALVIDFKTSHGEIF